MLKKVRGIVKPERDTKYGAYIKQSIEFLKHEARARARNVRINNILLIGQLYGMKTIFMNKLQGQVAVNCLINTQAARSYMHVDTARRIGAEIQPYTAYSGVLNSGTRNEFAPEANTYRTHSPSSGFGTGGIKGIAHMRFRVSTNKDKIIETCTNFLIIDKLDGDVILGAEF